MKQKKNSSKTISPCHDKQLGEVPYVYEEDFDDLQHTLRDFDFSHKNFSRFSSDDFE